MVTPQAVLVAALRSGDVVLRISDGAFAPYGRVTTATSSVNAFNEPCMELNVEALDRCESHVETWSVDAHFMIDIDARQYQITEQPC